MAATTIRFGDFETKLEVSEDQTSIGMILNPVHKIMTTIRFGDFETKLYLNVVPTSTPVEKSSIKLFTVYGTDCGLQTSRVAMVAVSTDTSSEDTITWELGCHARRFEILPKKSVCTYEWPKTTRATSVVSVGSHLYCIGGELESNLPCRKVFKLDTNNLAGGLEECDKMLQERAYPAVVSVGGKIYVFGGLAPYKEESSPWAEFLDTNKLKEEQEWKALQDPNFPHLCSKLGCTQIFAFPYDDQTILIGCGEDPNEDAVLYNVANKTWSRYECFPEIHTWGFASPLTVVSDKTIYWIDEDKELMAYELDKRVLYRGADIEFGDDHFLSTEYPPRLVHLEDNLFGFFSWFLGIKAVQCTKVRVTKVYMDLTGILCKRDSSQGYLQLDVVGYQSYRWEPIHQLSGVVSM